MSDEENIGGREGSGEEIESNRSDERQYRCRRCPPNSETFTAAELDTHRARHKAEDERRSRKRRGARGNSPSRSEVTLFEEITQMRTPPRGSPAKRGRPAKKNRSNKTYNTGVTGNWVKGTSG